MLKVNQSAYCASGNHMLDAIHMHVHLHMASVVFYGLLFGISEKGHHPNLSPASASSLHYLCSAFPHLMFKIHWTFKKCVGNECIVCRVMQMQVPSHLVSLYFCNTK